LIHLGAIWYLPATAPRDPSLGSKPIRLSHQSAAEKVILQEGDYLRIHHMPRRFRDVYQYDWGKHKNTENNDDDHDGKPGVIVKKDASKGWIVIDKPANVPVHMTVDNRVENAATCLEQALLAARRPNNPESSMTEQLYVTAPQRLDQNTSGLIVFAMTKVFANYFAGLLRNKTAHQLNGQGDDHVDERLRAGVHKLYRCLVCIVGDHDHALSGTSGWSVLQAVKMLRDYQTEDRVMRHYLEPSVRAPKRFAANAEAEDWAECLLKIKKVGDVCALVGNAPGRALAAALWDSPVNIPSQCQAVVELDIELLTGRTHQIRGQLSTAGFPLVGDAQYGGFVSLTTNYQQSARLALQCCKLEFLDPDVMVKTGGTEVLIRSQRWNTFELRTAWWTQLLETYMEQ